jgi:periplasmic divalent cation tolerance protein
MKFVQTDYVIVLTTVESGEQAEILAEKILSEKLATCIQVQKVKSFYTWRDKMECSYEYLLSMKTHADLFASLSKLIKQNHRYQVPEILQIPITNGSKEYFDWMKSIIN